MYDCFVDDCVIYREVTDSSAIDNLQMDLNRLGELTVEYEMNINTGKRKAAGFTKLG